MLIVKFSILPTDNVRYTRSVLFDASRSCLQALSPGAASAQHGLPPSEAARTVSRLQIVGLLEAAGALEDSLGDALFWRAAARGGRGHRKREGEG